jgi:hypothetical protein
VAQNVSAMIPPFQMIIDNLEVWFRQLEQDIPAPQKVDFKDGHRFRFIEKSIQQAALLKLSRYINGLRGIWILLEAGYCQEIGALQRTLDDIEEDMMFLALGLATGNWTARHEEYMEAFWSEDEDVGMVKRDKIRAFVHNAGNPENPSDGIASAKSIFKTYSGYIHSNASTSIDLWCPEIAAFCLSGILNSPLYDDHKADVWNQFYRGIVCATSVSRICNNAEVNGAALSFLRSFEAEFAEMIFPVSPGKA